MRRSAPAPNESAAAVDVHMALADARESYRAPSINIPTTVILSDEFEEYDLPTEYLAGIVTRPSSWKRLLEQHGRLLLPPMVDVVAGEIRAAVDEAERNASG